MDTNRAPRVYRWLGVALLGLTMATGLGACGSDSAADAESVMPTIVSVKTVDESIRVGYRAPGASGGEWPVLRISVREADGLLPPTSEEARPVVEEGSVVVPIKVRPGQDLLVYGSVFYEDGRRVHLPERHFSS